MRATGVPSVRDFVRTSYDSPIGRLTLVASDHGLAAVLWDNERPDRLRPYAAARPGKHDLLGDAATELDEYFAGSRRVFEVALDPIGTPFRLRVWEALRRIPFGATTSYGEIARDLGDPGCVRAVGAANGRNPLSIIVPCHRVVGADGSLTGFAGGLSAKAHLLDLERGVGGLFRS